MRRVQIYLDETLDDVLAGEAVKQRTSKAALIRRLVAQGLGLESAVADDPFARLIGRYPGDPGDVDQAVYGPQPDR